MIHSYVFSFLTSLTPPTYIFFFFNDTATTEIYTLSLHDALPISSRSRRGTESSLEEERVSYKDSRRIQRLDRKSTRLNSSHGYISYAVFCLKKKKKKNKNGIQYDSTTLIMGCKWRNDSR